MQEPPEIREFELSLEEQFNIRRFEIESQELTWDGLHHVLMCLYQQRLLEWHAIKEILADEKIELTFDIPTNIELSQFSSLFEEEDFDSDEDDEDEDDDDKRRRNFVSV
jgi:hypothetical protein